MGPEGRFFFAARDAALEGPLFHGIIGAWLVVNVLPGSIGGRAALQRRVTGQRKTEPSPVGTAGNAARLETERISGIATHPRK